MYMYVNSEGSDKLHICTFSTDVLLLEYVIGTKFHNLAILITQSHYICRLSVQYFVAHSLDCVMYIALQAAYKHLNSSYM